MVYRICMTWDGDAAVWIATSNDVPGLVLESGSFDALVERVKNTIPELLDLNSSNTQNFYLDYFTERKDRVLVNG